MPKTFSTILLSILLSIAYSSAYANDTLSCSSISIPSEEEFLLLNPSSDLDHSAILCFLKLFNPQDKIAQNSLDIIRKADDFYWYYFDKYEFELAMKFVEMQSQFWQQIDSSRQYNKSIYNMANCYFHLGNYGKSFELLQESIDLATSNNDDRRLMLSYNKLSWLLLRINRYEEAGKANKLFLYHIKKSNLGNNYLISYYNFSANLHAEKGDMVKAKYYSDSSLYYANQIGDEKLIAIAKSNGSMFYKGSEKLTERINLVKKALAINIRSDNKGGIGANYKYLGELYNMTSKSDSTFKYYSLALQIQKSIGDQYQEYLTHEKLVTYFENISNYNRAYFHQKKATEMYMELFGAIESIKIYEIEKQISDRKIETAKLILLKQNAQIELGLLKNNQKKLFLLLISFFFIGLLYLYYYRHQNLQKLAKLKLKKEAEKEIINLRKQAIRSQLNPHFLFNNLNSIKSYIAGNEPRNATRYLNKFAQLMRTILNNSIKDKVPLNEEIEALKLFIEIEKYRTKSEIELDVVLDNNIDYNSIQVSPSILQPFVENGIFQFCKDQSTFYVHLSIEDVNEKEIVVNIKMHSNEDLQTMPSRRNNSNESNLQTAYDIKDKKGNSIGTSVTFRILKEIKTVEP